MNKYKLISFDYNQWKKSNERLFDDNYNPCSILYDNYLSEVKDEPMLVVLINYEYYDKIQVVSRKNTLLYFKQEMKYEKGEPVMFKKDNEVFWKFGYYVSGNEVTYNTDTIRVSELTDNIVSIKDFDFKDGL